MGQIDHANLTEKVYSVILKRIVGQELPLGARLNEAELAAELGISKAPLREALIVLSKEGFVSWVTRRGFFVRTFADKDIIEIIQIRIALETLALKLAAPHLSNEFDLLRLLLRQEREAAVAHNLAAADDADIAFHATIVAASGNTRLIELVQNYRHLNEVFRRLDTSKPLQFVEEHARILDLLERGDAEGARQQLEDHIQGHLQRMLQNTQQPGNTWGSEK